MSSEQSHAERLGVSQEVDDMNENERDAVRVSKQGSAGAGHFIGDYTESRVAKKARRVVLAKRKARDAAKLQQVRSRHRNLRLCSMVLAGCFVAALSSLLGGTVSQPKALKVPPPIQANSVKDALAAILPVKVTMVRDGVARVMVAREWLDVPEAQRQYAAETALVTLQNRGIDEFSIHCTDGLLVASGLAGEGVTLHHG